VLCPQAEDNAADVLGEKARSEASACVSFGVRSATAARTISPRAQTKPRNAMPASRAAVNAAPVKETDK